MELRRYNYENVLTVRRDESTSSNCDAAFASESRARQEAGMKRRPTPRPFEQHNLPEEGYVSMAGIPSNQIPISHSDATTAVEGRERQAAGIEGRRQHRPFEQHNLLGEGYVSMAQIPSNQLPISHSDAATAVEGRERQTAGMEGRRQHRPFEQHNLPGEGYVSMAGIPSNQIPISHSDAATAVEGREIQAAGIEGRRQHRPFEQHNLPGEGYVSMAQIPSNQLPISHSDAAAEAEGRERQEGQGHLRSHDDDANSADNHREEISVHSNDVRDRRSSVLPEDETSASRAHSKETESPNADQRNASRAQPREIVSAKAYQAGISHTASTSKKDLLLLLLLLFFLVIIAAFAIALNKISQDKEFIQSELSEIKVILSSLNNSVQALEQKNAKLVEGSFILSKLAQDFSAIKVIFTSLNNSVRTQERNNARRNKDLSILLQKVEEFSDMKLIFTSLNNSVRTLEQKNALMNENIFILHQTVEEFAEKSVIFTSLNDTVQTLELQNARMNKNVLILDQMMQGCDNMYLRVCYWADIHSSRNINYTRAETICREGRSTVAEIVDEAHYRLLAAIIRSKIPSSLTNVYAWTGMQKNLSTNNVMLSTGVESYTEWRSNEPRNLTQETGIVFYVTKNAESSDQGMDDASPSSYFRGVVCQNTFT